MGNTAVVVKPYSIGDEVTVSTEGSGGDTGCDDSFDIVEF